MTERIATLVQSAENGDVQAREQLFVTLYNELRRMAEGQVRRSANNALSPTTLLHETFISMISRNAGSFSSRTHFMAYAARAMRGLLIDFLRNRLAQRRGGQFLITSLPAEVAQPFGADVELERMNEALEALGVSDPRLAELVDLKFFCGFSFVEIAQIMEVSERTAKRDWEKARLLLHRFVSDGT